MLRFEKVATPFTAPTLVVPERVPPPGLVPIATVTVPVKAVAGFPHASRAVPRDARPMLTTAGVLVGWIVNASRVAGAGVMLKLALVAPVRPLAAAVSV